VPLPDQSRKNSYDLKQNYDADDVEYHDNKPPVKKAPGKNDRRHFRAAVTGLLKINLIK